MSEMLTVKQALELLHEVVEEVGEDHRYQQVPSPSSDAGSAGCRYEYNGAPSCLVGHVLHRAGWPLSALQDLDTRGVGAEELYYVELPDGTPGVTQGAARVLNRAQGRQDLGDTWGTALEAAVEMAAERSSSGS